MNPTAHAARSALRAWWQTTTHLVYPALCLGCDHRLGPRSDALPLCGPCEQRLPRASQTVIRERLASLPAAAGVFRAAHGLWVFDDGGTVQRLQHLLKYGNRPTLARDLGRRLGRALLFDGTQPTYDAVVPIPLARPRALERGYNQSASLALGLAAALGQTGVVQPDALVRSRATRSQTALSRSARWRNVAGAFHVREPEALAGRRVLLVDDVLTTGATLTAAAHALRAAGAEVDLAVFAVAAI